jgi:hypothetical protein
MSHRPNAPTLGDSAGVQSSACGCCPNCKATHWIAAAITAQKKLEDMINLHLQQQLEIGQLRRHVTELNNTLDAKGIAPVSH